MIDVNVEHTHQSTTRFVCRQNIV